MVVTDKAGLTIGQLAERVGLSADVLRAWERRYALLTPRRTDSGYRLYSDDDARLVRRVVALRDQGFATAQAVAAAREMVADSPDPHSAERMEALAAAVGAFDEEALEAAVEAAFAGLGVAGAVRDVVLPYLVRLGEDWAAGVVGVGHEHFASQVLRRLVALRAAPPPEGGRPVAVLANPPGERHDLGLLCFTVLLGQSGWATRFLGADTPLAALQLACEQLEPDAVVVSATRESGFLARAGGLRRVAREWPMAVGGQGATERVATELGAWLLPDDVVAAVPVLEQAVGSRVA
jgi:DNA-binding transcriptional MerR regulator